MPRTNASWHTGPGVTMFAVYSNRLGCIGSIAVSVIGTAILVLVIWMINR